MRKTVIAAAMAASLTVGGAAGVALYTPTLSGAEVEEEGPVPEATETEPGGAERAEPAERIARLLAPLVEDGTITQAQADAVAERLAEAMPTRHGRHRGFILDMVEAVSEALGVEPAELRDRLAAGESIAEIAEAEGITLEAVTDAVVAAHRDRLDQAVADGRLTQEQADELAARFAERIDALVERGAEAGRHFGLGHHRMRGGMDRFAPGNEGADDTTGS